MNTVQPLGHYEPQFLHILGCAIDKRQFFDVTTPGADVEYEITHRLGVIPIGYLVIRRDKAANTYIGTTAWTGEKIYLKTNVATAALRILVF